MTPSSPGAGGVAPSGGGPPTSPVDPEAQWRAPWQPVTGEDRSRLLAEVAGEVRGSLPPTTEVHRQRLACYPRHVLLRFVVPGESPRETYAFHAPGQLYPLDWTWATIEAFDEVGLEVASLLQAEDRLRFVLWGLSRSAGRSFVVESPERLTPADGRALDPGLVEHLASHLHALTALPARDDGGPDGFRFRVPLLYDGRVAAFDFEVPASGPPEGAVVDLFEPVSVPGTDDRVTGDRFFVLVRETSLTADGFLRKIRAGSLHQARVVEPVDLRNQVFEEPVTLSQVTFEHGAGFEGAQFEKGLTLDQCVVEGRLVLRDARVRGPLHASRLAFHREGVHRDDPSLARHSRYGRYRVDLDAGGLRVEGSAYLEGLRAVHVVDLSRARVEGDLRLGGSLLGEDGTARTRSDSDFLLRMDRLRVGGDLDLAYTRDPGSRLPDRHPDPSSEGGAPGLSGPRTVVRGAIQAMAMDVGGELILCGLRCEGSLILTDLTLGADLNAGAHPPGRPLIVGADLHLSGSTIGGGVLLNGARVEGELSFHTSRVEGSVFARTPATEFGRDRPLRVHGQVDFSGTRVGDIELEGARLGGLRMITGEIGRLRLTRGVEEVSGAVGGDAGPREVRLVPFRAGSILLWDLTVRKRMALRVHVEDEGDVRLGNVDCGGDVELWADPGVSEDPDELLAEGETWAGGTAPTPFDSTTEIPGDLTCTGVRVAGRALFANVRCGGRILLKNCEIGQDLGFGSHGPDPGSVEGRTRTECRELDLELTSCGGDVDLSGLVVAGDGAASCLQARQLRVSGRILFARPLGERQDRVELLSDGDRVEARVEGDVDLSVAEAAHLVLVGDAVGGRVNLERGRFRRLQVLEPGRMEGHNLADVQVERWDIPDAALGPFLDGSDPFDRAAYVQVERLLRNRAQDAEADRVYRAMRDRAIREARYERRGVRPPRSGRRRRPRPRERWWTRVAQAPAYALRTAGSRLQGILYGWGTLYWAPLLGFTLLVMPFSWALLSEPSNVVATPELAAASGIPVEGSDPSAYGVDWGPADGFWLTVRYHVPVVPLSARAEFRPSRDAAVLQPPGGTRLRFAFSAESWAFAVYLASWVLWPLFLVGLARRIVRETT